MCVFIHTWNSEKVEFTGLEKRGQEKREWGETAYRYNVTARQEERVTVFYYTDLDYSKQYRNLQ